MHTTASRPLSPPPLPSGSPDESTWEGVDYRPLIESVWKDIGVLPHHQQRCENYVQMAALIAKTLIGESRRTWRAILVSALIRPFNSVAVERKRNAEENEKKRANIKRVDGAYRLEHFNDYLADFLTKIERALQEEAGMGFSVYQGVVPMTYSMWTRGSKSNPPKAIMSGNGKRGPEGQKVRKWRFDHEGGSGDDSASDDAPVEDVEEPEAPEEPEDSAPEDGGD